MKPCFHKQQYLKKGKRNQEWAHRWGLGMAWGKSEWTVLKPAGHCAHIDDLSWSLSLCILPAACLQCVQDHGNTACMFYNLVYSHMIVYEPGYSYRIFFYGLVCVCIILDVLLWSYMFFICHYSMLYDFMFVYVFIYSSMILYVRIWCSCVFLYVLLWSYMMFYDLIYILCCYFLFFYDPVYSMMFFRCFSMILYVIVCAYDYLLWWYMFLYSSMTLFIWSSIILHVICLYIFFMSRSHVFMSSHMLLCVLEWTLYLSPSWFIVSSWPQWAWPSRQIIQSCLCATCAPGSCFWF